MAVRMHAPAPVGVLRVGNLVHVPLWPTPREECAPQGRTGPAHRSFLLLAYRQVNAFFLVVWGCGFKSVTPMLNVLRLPFYKLGQSFHTLLPSAPIKV